MYRSLFLLLYLHFALAHSMGAVPEASDNVTTEQESNYEMEYSETTNYEKRMMSSVNVKHHKRRRHMKSNLKEEVEEDQRTEFVRTQWSEATYKKVRTYSAIPKQIECYSCMSLSYQTSWKYLQTTYIYPKVFTDRCREPSQERAMPTVMCSTVCASLLEPDIEAGVLIGFKHIRGCMDRILRNGFNESAIRTHRFQQNNQCRTLSRSHLFNPIKGQDHYVALGEVQLCSCYGDRCNSSAFSAGNPASLVLYVLPVLIALFRLPWPNI